MYLTPLNYDRFFKKVFSELRIAKQFLEDYSTKVIFHYKSYFSFHIFMKKHFLSFILLFASAAMMAQTAVTIQQIQNVSAGNLTACVDSSSYNGQTVTVKGTVVMPYGLAVSGAGLPLRNVWIQSGTGAFSGLDVFAVAADPASADIMTLLAGDSVEITGTVTEFSTSPTIPKVETELATITSVNILATGRPVNVQTINAGDLNDNAQLNVLPTGEQWEGSFVELQNVTVISVDPFGSNRISFRVQDAAGNIVNVSDRFMVQHLPATGGTFTPPAVGTVYCSLKGIIMHSPNGCKNYPTGRGYELHPFDAAHYAPCTGQAPPQIAGISVNPMVPTSSQSPVVSATITDVDGTVTSATLYYAVGVSNTSYTSVPMTASGSTYTASIPAQSNNAFVKYYICATDNDNHTVCNTNVPGGNSNPYVYLVKDNGLTIYDVQYTPFTDGNSIFKDKNVTLTGIVTASAEPNNLGYVFIQQEGGLLGWAGIMCIGNPQLASLKVGDKVTVTGDVKESFGCTRLENITSVAVNGTGSIGTLTLDPSVFSTYDFATNEAYEGMLVTIAKQAIPGPIYVVNNNADAPADNFAEYRVGTDVLAPDNGCRIIAGSQTGSSYSSLNVSYVNDAQWVPNAGITQTVVQYGDCMSSVTGIIYYSFSNMKLLPRNNDDFVNYWAACVNNIEDGLLSQVQVNAFPSPASETLKVSYKFPSNWAAQAQLFDVNGRVVATNAFEGANGEITFDLTNINTGVYFLQITSDNTQVYSGKVNVVK